MGPNLISTLKGCRSWDDLKRSWFRLSKKQKGNLFEELVKHYLLLEPEYSSKIAKVWLLKEVPTILVERLKLPPQDKGIDLVAETKEGEYWAIQCKYKQESDQSVTWREISTFTGLAFGVCRGFSFGLIASTTERITKVLKDQDRIGFAALDVWQGLDGEFFSRLQARLKHKRQPLEKRLPRPHQKEALKDAVAYFAKKSNTRGKLIMPCGTGKSLTSYFIAQGLKARKVLIAVPSLALIKQTLKEWMRESMARGQDVEWICVCSDESATRIERDDIAVLTHDIAVPRKTGLMEIVNWLKKRHHTLAVVFTTYQSSHILAKACRKAGYKFDLGILDEAHKTTGPKDKRFAHLLSEKNISIRKRLFMTATERCCRDKTDKVFSMDDSSFYGEELHHLSFKKALQYKDPPVLVDYRPITISVSKDEVAALIKSGEYIRPKGWTEKMESEGLVALVALRKAMRKYPIRHAVTFHSSIRRARAFRDFNDVYSKRQGTHDHLNAYHVCGTTPTGSRARIINSFAKDARALITNARCLTEGIDVPNIDAVLFADPARSRVDIVQAVGRALRPHKGKALGYVILPIVHNKRDKFEKIITSTSYKEILLILTALNFQDSRIREYFGALAGGKSSTDRGGFKVEIDERISKCIDLKDFENTLRLKIWERLAKFAWRPFEKARTFARNLHLRSGDEWSAYARGDLKDLPPLPADIPKAPSCVYVEYISDPDWLGTSNVHKNSFVYRDWNEAVTFVRGLGLKSSTDWQEYCAGKFRHLPAKPIDIPSNPQKVYPQYDRLAKKGLAMGYWLGTKELSPRHRVFWSYKKARKYAHRLNLKSHPGWNLWVDKQKKMPPGLPKAPHLFYEPWPGWGDFLGTGTIATKKTPKRPFKDARRFVHSLKLRGSSAVDSWRNYCHGKTSLLPPRPLDIPSNPDKRYTKEEGWVDYSDWTGISKKRNWKCRPFQAAKAYFRKLNIKTDNPNSWWEKYLVGTIANMPPRPLDIPRGPRKTYRKDWKGWVDFLGCQAKTNP